jgi:hypothetical protein
MNNPGVPVLLDLYGMLNLSGDVLASFRFFLGVPSSASSFVRPSGAKLWRTKNSWIVVDRKEVTTFLF